jgi:hypothetical protein
MGPGSHDTALRLAAALSFAIALYLLGSSWDGLYERLELAQGAPALTAQIGGAGMLGLAYFLWAASSQPAAVPLAARAGFLAHGLGALIIAAWLIFRDRQDIGVDSSGIVILAVLAVLLAGSAVALGRTGR